MSNQARTQIDPETGTVYSRDELKAAFDRVEDPSNWKNPIVGKEIPADQETITNEAIIFYAGGRAKFVPSRPGFVKVSAPGYYAVIGA